MKRAFLACLAISLLCLLLTGCQHEHTPVTDPAVAPTCAAEGKTEGSHCSVCNTIITAQQTVAKTAHTPITDPAVAPTCAAEGKTEGSHCSVCNTTITAQQAVAKTAHTPVTDAAAVEATCTTEGKTEGSHCSVCNTTLTVQQTVGMKEHTTSAVYSFNSQKHWKSCSVCGRTVKEGEHTFISNNRYCMSCYAENPSYDASDNVVVLPPMPLH